MHTGIVFAETIVPAEAVYFYMGAFALVAALCLAGFVVGLVLTSGSRRKLGVRLASACALLLVIIAICFVNFFSH